MPTIRIHKHQHNFVILDTTCLNDTRLSYRARGLHAYLMSKPDNWHVNITHLKQQSEKEGREAVRTALKELLDCGYAECVRTRNQHGLLYGSETVVYETPQTINRKPVEPTSVEPIVGQSPTNKDCILERIEEEISKPLPSVKVYAGNDSEMIPAPPMPTNAGVPLFAKKKKKKQPLASDDPLRLWLQTQEILDIPFTYLDDEEWWALNSQLVTDGIDEHWLQKEFIKMALRFSNGEKAPRTQRGWRKFFTHWFGLADKINEREQRKEKFYGTQTSSTR